MPRVQVPRSFTKETSIVNVEPTNLRDAHAKKA
jgi:hypothetical protein